MFPYSSHNFTVHESHQPTTDVVDKTASEKQQYSKVSLEGDINQQTFTTGVSVQTRSTAARHMIFKKERSLKKLLKNIRSTSSARCELVDLIFCNTL